MSLYEEQDRRQQFKTAFSPREARKRREEAWALLRSRKRDEALSRRRREEPSPPASPVVPEEMDWSREEAVCGADEPEAEEEVISLEDLPRLADAMVDGGDEEQRQATSSLRKLLARGDDPPIDAIDAVVAAGLLPPLIRLLSATNANVQYEAAWALTNVASGTPAHTEAMLAHGAVAALVALLKSPSERLQEQAAWALGNIAGDAAQGKLAVLAQAAIPLLVALGRTVTRGPLLRQVAWTLSNLCRNTGPAEFEQLLPALPLLVQWMGHPDSEVHTSACWAIAHLCDGPSEHVAAVLAANVVPRLAELLKSPKRSVQSPALHLMGNIVAGENRQTQFLINSGLLPFLHAFLAHPDKDLQKEACWALSNIAAGSQAQIQAILNANLIPPVLRLLGSADVDVRREAAWCVCNALAGGDAMQIVYLVQQGCLPPICELLLSADAKLVSMALEGLESILSVGQDQKPWTNGVNAFAQYMLETGCVDRLERLQSHPNTRVYEQATELLERFFAADHMEDSLMTPSRDTSCLYSDFATSSPPQFVLA